MRRKIAILALLTAGCAQLPPTVQDLQSKKFESIAGKAVIYIARPGVDSPTDGPIAIGNNGVITTHPGTYYRWETEPGSLRIAGYGPFNASVTVQAQAGRIYYVLHTVKGTFRDGTLSMHLQQVDERYGRKLVADGQLL